LNYYELQHLSLRLIAAELRFGRILFRNSLPPAEWPGS
jgi:hypothetical protein